jgi:hypothetical protein
LLNFNILQFARLPAVALALPKLSAKRRSAQAGLPAEALPADRQVDLRGNRRKFL